MLYPFFIAFLKIGSVLGSVCESFVVSFFAKECKGIMEPVGVEPTSKHLPTYLSTTIGYVLV